MSIPIDNLLTECYSVSASDLHLSPGLPPKMRLHGDIVTLPHWEQATCFSGEDIFNLVRPMMSASLLEQYEKNLECDFSYSLPGVSRFRVNVFTQLEGTGSVMRTIPSKIPTLESLNAPSVLKQLVKRPRGLFLVTGPTGSGKSTTLAAMIHHLNCTEAAHVLTIEDPVEFVHCSQSCLINQREVGNNTHSFSNALRSALREDPDVILVGEMRDVETIRLALTAAETGHLVLATLHTNDAAKTIDRIVDVFPGEEKNMIRTMLSESIVGVVSQTLCKRSDGQGRVAAFEVMIANAAIRNLIREAKVAQMYSTIQLGQQDGMQTLDQSLEHLLATGMIDITEAQAKAKMPEKLTLPQPGTTRPASTSRSVML